MIQTYFLNPKALKLNSSWDVYWLQNQAKTILHSNQNDDPCLQSKAGNPSIITESWTYAFLKCNNHKFFWKCAILQNILKFKYTLFPKLLPVKIKLIQKPSGVFFPHISPKDISIANCLNDDSIWKTVVIIKFQVK